MRTTLSLDDDAAEMAKRYAERRSIGLGKAISELVKRALTTKRPTRSVNGLHVFDLPPDSPRVTTAQIKDLDAENS